MGATAPGHDCGLYAASMIFWSKEAERRVLECYRGILDSWATPHTEQRLSTSQGETFVLSAGDPAKPPVMLLPGSMASSAMWLPTMDVLSSDHHVLAVDIIGDAGYSAPSRPWITSEAHARWLDDVLDRLSLESAAFVGASFGGLLALDYAVRRHARVERLALLAPGGLVHIRFGAVLRAVPLMLLGPWGHRKALNVDMGFSGDDARAENKDFLNLFSLVQSGFVARMQILPRLSDIALKTLTMPILAVLGGKDSLFDSQAARKRLVTCVPHAEIIYLSEAGHALHDMTPEIKTFLDSRACQQTHAAGRDG
ncbi:MAG TPA: alpha/beta hydrolase [Steroidobacteraceae bacterium]